MKWKLDGKPFVVREIYEKNLSGSLYHYFPNKEGMMNNLFEVIGVREAEKAYEFSFEGKTVVECLDRLFTYVLDHEVFFQNLLRSEGAFDIGREFGILMLNML